MFLKKNFTSDAGAGETIAQGRRLQRTTVKNAERKIQYNLGRLEKAVKKEYGSFDNVPPRLMSQLVAGVEGRLWELEGVLPQTKEILTDMRRSIDDAQQQLIDIGAVEPGSELQYKINRSQSTDYAGAVQGPPQEGESLKFYMNTSYDVFDKPNYKVNPKDREAGRQYFIDKFSQSSAAENAAIFSPEIPAASAKPDRRCVVVKICPAVTENLSLRISIVAAKAANSGNVNSRFLPSLAKPNAASSPLISPEAA